MQATEIVALLESIGADKIQVRQNDVTCTCPVHKESRPSFGVKIASPHVFNCYACHTKGLLPKLLMLTNRLTWKEAIHAVNKFGAYSIEDAMFHTDTAVMAQDGYGADVLDLSIFSSTNRCMRNYLRRRKISEAVWVQASLKRSGERIVFPWYRYRQLLGFTTRSFLSSVDSCRGMSLFGFKKHKYLYRAGGSSSKETYSRLYVVEGEFDALRLQTLGYNACAIGGTAPTKEQAEELCKLTTQVVMLFDNDPQGKEAASRLQRLLYGRMCVLTPTITDSEYSDPGALSKSLAESMLSDSNLEPCF